MRLSIEITPEQHQRLKAAAALQGKSIKEYVLERTLPDATQAEALQALEAMLKLRIEAAEAGGVVTQSLDDIFDSEIRKFG